MPGKSQNRAGDVQLGFLLADVLRLLRADFFARARGLSLTPALYRLLFYIDRRPGCRQVELADWLEITPVTVGRMIDRLEGLGLVRRENCPGDRRATRVVLDERGRALMDRLGGLRNLTHERACQGLDAAEYDQLIAALTRIRRNLSDSPPPVAHQEPARRGRRSDKPSHRHD